MSIHIQYPEPSGAVDDQAALEQFQKQWTTYQKLVDHDSIDKMTRWRSSTTR